MSTTTSTETIGRLTGMKPRELSAAVTPRDVSLPRRAGTVLVAGPEVERCRAFVTQGDDGNLHAGVHYLSNVKTADKDGGGYLGNHRPVNLHRHFGSAVAVQHRVAYAAAMGIMTKLAAALRPKPPAPVEWQRDVREINLSRLADYDELLFGKRRKNYWATVR